MENENSNGKNKVDNKSADIKNPFEDEKQDKKYNRSELMKLPGRELAKLAKPFSKFQITTLSGMSKSDLCDIILGLKKEDEKKPKARFTSTKSESENIIDLTLNTLLTIKKARDGDNATINPIAHELFKSSAVSKVDKARASDTLNNDKINTAIFAVSSAAILVDTLIGFDKIPGLFKKIRDKVKNKKASNEADAK